MNHTEIIDALTAILKERRHADPESSYVASLHARGLNKILEKVGEEAIEVIIAAKESAGTASGTTSGTASGTTAAAAPPGPARDTALIGEVADLWFHSLVLLVHLGQEPEWVLQTLAERFGVSGHEEKRRRAAPSPPAGSDDTAGRAGPGAG